MLYNLLKNLIVNKYYEKEDMSNKLNVFMLYNQISEEQYAELIAIVNPIVVPKLVQKVEEKKETETEQPKEEVKTINNLI